MKNICWLGWGIPMGLLFSVMFASHVHLQSRPVLDKSKFSSGAPDVK